MKFLNYAFGYGVNNALDVQQVTFFPPFHKKKIWQNKIIQTINLCHKLNSKVKTHYKFMPKK